MAEKEYIDREALIKMIGNKPSSPTTEREDRLINAFISTVGNFPAANVVSRDCYDRLLAENDKLRKERPVVRGKWIETKTGFHCSACKTKAKGTKDGALLSNFCPKCGAMMEER